MPIRVTSWSQTPNPNARRLDVAPAPDVQRKSFRSATDARGESLAERLFGVRGVEGLYFGGTWITVNKSPAAAWPAVQQEVERVLAAEA